MSGGPNAFYAYEMVDATGAVIYVGMTKRVSDRLRTHSTFRDWWPSVAHVRVTPCADRASALDLEAQLIDRHRPIHNVLKNVDRSAREPGEAIDAILRLMTSAARPMSTGELRRASGNLNAAEVLKRLHDKGQVKIVEYVPAGGRVGYHFVWALPSDPTPTAAVPSDLLARKAVA